MELGLRESMLRLPMPPRTRSRLLRLFGAKVGRNVRLHPVRVINPCWSNLRIGSNAYIGADVLLDLSAPLTIGRGAVIASAAAIATHQDAGHAHGSRTAARIGTFLSPTTIGDEAFLGIGSIVLAGCSVGAGSVVGAGAVVTRPVADGAVVTGSPARPLAVDGSRD